MSSNIRIQKVCQYCGAEFIAKTTKTQYCGDKCAKRAYKARKRKEKLHNVKPVDQQKASYHQSTVEKKEYLSVAETCSLLGASRMTIYRQIKRGNIPAAKIGRRTIIKRSELEKLFTHESHTQRTQKSQIH